MGLLELQQMLMSLQHMEDKEESIRWVGGGAEELRREDRADVIGMQWSEAASRRRASGEGGGGAGRN